LTTNSIKYSLGSGPARNSKTVYLWRECSETLEKVATFSSVSAAALFAKEFDFPLSDSVKKLIEEG
jgi:hypothetical protein